MMASFGICFEADPAEELALSVDLLIPEDRTASDLLVSSILMESPERLKW